MTAGARHEITALICRYAELIDLGDFAGVGRLFADATFRAVAGDSIAVRRGANEVEEQFRQLVKVGDDGTPGTKHVTTNVVINVDETNGTASSRSYFTVLQAAPGPTIVVVVAGRYHDQFARRDGAWHFADRLIHTDQVGDISGHLRGRPFG